MSGSCLPSATDPSFHPSWPSPGSARSQTALARRNPTLASPDMVLDCRSGGCDCRPNSRDSADCIHRLSAHLELPATFRTSLRQRSLSRWPGQGRPHPGVGGEEKAPRPRPTGSHQYPLTLDQQTPTSTPHPIARQPAPPVGGGFCGGCVGCVRGLLSVSLLLAGGGRAVSGTDERASGERTVPDDAHSRGKSRSPRDEGQAARARSISSWKPALSRAPR